MPRKTNFERLQYYDRGAADGRVVVWDGFMAAVGTASIVALPDDESGEEQSRFEITERSTARVWLHDHFESPSVYNVEMSAKSVRDFFTKHARGSLPVSVLDQRLQLAPALVHYVLEPLLRPKSVTTCLVEMVDFNNFGRDVARIGARFSVADATALIAPARMVETEVPILIPDDLIDLLDRESPSW